MNVALAYFSADDHWQDDRRPDALALRRLLRPHYEAIQSRFPRQCRAMRPASGTCAAWRRSTVPTRTYLPTASAC